MCHLCRLHKGPASSAKPRTPYAASSGSALCPEAESCGERRHRALHQSFASSPHLAIHLNTFVMACFEHIQKQRGSEAVPLASMLSPPGQWPSFLCPPVTRPHYCFEAKPQHRPFSLHLCKVTRTLHLHPGLRAKAGQRDRRDPRLFLGDTG